MFISSGFVSDFDIRISNLPVLPAYRFRPVAYPVRGSAFMASSRSAPTCTMRSE
jgi:hypothetical protein